MLVTQEYVVTTGRTSVAMGTLKRVGIAVPPDFPIAFIEPPNVQITLHHCWLGWLLGIEGQPTETNATGGNLIPIAAAETTTIENIKVNILAIGKWK